MPAITIRNQSYYTSTSRQRRLRVGNRFHGKLKSAIETTNEELSKLSLLFKANKLSLNITKTNDMFFSNRKKILNQNMNIKIDGIIVNRVKNCKFLGVIIDENLTWMRHTNLVTSKISKNIGVMHKLSYYLFTDAIKNPILYFSISVHSLRQYCLG